MLSTTATRPTTIRITPTALTSTPSSPAGSTLNPGGCSGLRGGDEQLARRAARLRPERWELRQLLEHAEHEAGADEGRHDLAGSCARSLGEVVAAPAHHLVEADEDRVRHVQDQLAARAERGRDPRRPGVQVGGTRQRAAGGEDEVAPPALECGGQMLGVAEEPRQLRV